MRGIFDLFFNNNYNMYVFLFFVGVFVLECYFIYNKDQKIKMTKEVVLSFGAVSALISAITIFKTDFTEHDYLGIFRPKKVSCLLEAYETAWSNPAKEYIDTVRSIHPVCSKSFEISSVYQILVLLAIFSLGWFLCNLCINKTGMQNVFLSYPVGLCMASAIGLILHIVGIPINKVSLLICFVLLLAIMILQIKKRSVRIEKIIAIRQWILAVLISAFSVLANLFFLSPDGVVKTFVGFKLAEIGLTRAEFLYEVEYGVVEPILTCIGLKLSVDFLYGIYILMPICCIGLLLTSIKQLVDNKNMGILFAGIGSVLLITNHDFLFCGTYVLSNGIMACLILSLVIVMLYEMRGFNTLWIVALIAMAIITIRIEASCYICLIVALLCGIKQYRENNMRDIFVLGAEMILWQVYMLIFAPKDLMFWNPLRGVIVIVASVIMMAIPFILKIKQKPINWICTNYYKVAIFVFVVSSLAMFIVVPNTYFDVAQVFLAHFASAPDSNSLALWGFVLLMLPLLSVNRNKTTGLLISLVICYLLAIFVIFVCRTNDPIHLQMNDSCRRAIVQVMPSAMFMVAYILGDMKFEK